MPSESNQHHNRRSIRLAGYDYSQAGAYFVTICTYRRECLFGMIQNNQPVLSQHGQIVAQCWNSLAEHFSFLALDAFVIMPDHLHGIIVIYEHGQSDEPVLNGTKPRSLSAVIQNFKSVSTRRVHQALPNDHTPIWQRGYYERVIRNSHELARIQRYIETNPARWNKEI